LGVSGTVAVAAASAKAPVNATAALKIPRPEVQY